MTLVMNIAHRGASHYAPENTLASFYKAMEMGAQGIETDLRKTKDGVIFLFHDDVLDRTSNGSGVPSEYNWSELSKLDVGSWFSPRYTGERILSFDLLLQLFDRKPCWFVFELKEGGIEEEVLSAIYRHGIEDRVTITSFKFNYLEEVRRIDPNIHIGYITEKIDAATIARVNNSSIQQICPKAEFISPEDVTLAKEHSLQVRAWSVMSEELMHHCISCGVDGMTINFPDKLNKII